MVEVGCGALGVWDVGMRDEVRGGVREEVEVAADVKFDLPDPALDSLDGIRDSCRCLLKRSGEYTVARCRYVG